MELSQNVAVESKKEGEEAGKGSEDAGLLFTLRWFGHSEKILWCS
jgi:hypothetical protein